MFLTAHANWDSAKSVSTKDKEVQGEEDDDDDEKERTETFMRPKEDVVDWVLGFCFMSGNRLCWWVSCLYGRRLKK